MIFDDILDLSKLRILAQIKNSKNPARILVRILQESYQNLKRLHMQLFCKDFRALQGTCRNPEGSSDPVDTRRRFNVFTTSATLDRRLIAVEPTSCVHWVHVYEYH